MKPEQDVTLFGNPAKTDANGLAVLNINEGALAIQGDYFAVVSEATAFGVGETAFSQGLQPYAFSMPTAFEPQYQTVYLYSDRSVYQPGQPVYFRGVVRSKNDVTYGLMSLKSVYVRITDFEGKDIYGKQVPLTPFGTLADSFTLDENAGLGSYTIIALPGFTGTSEQAKNYQGPT